MEAKNVLKVEDFVLECNDMLSGKFLDLKKRLEKFLSVMTKSEDILNFLSECLEDFDEEAEFSSAFSVNRDNAKVSIPSDDKKKLALCVTIFNDITNDKLNANQFLETYFQDRKLTPTQNFLDKIVRPYRDLMCKYFELPVDITAEDVKKQKQEAKAQQQKTAEAKVEAEFPHLDELMSEIVKICNQMLALLKFEKKRTDTLDDVEFVLGSIIKECEKRDLMVINGLVIGLTYCSKKFRNIRHLVDDLTDLIFNYYEFLAEISKSEEK